MQQPDPLLRQDQEKQIKSIAKNHPKENIRRRARLLVSYNKGASTREVAQEVGLSPQRTRYWRRQFLLKGMDIFPKMPEDMNRLDGEGADQAGPETENKALEEPEGAVIYEISEPGTPGEGKPPEQESETVQPIELGQDNQVAEKVEESGSSELPFPEKMDSVGILPTDTMAEAGRKILLFQFAEMLSHEAGTQMGQDSEELHDMRVATRRMRAAFNVFGYAFEPKAIKSFKRELKDLGGKLGRARDMDVLLEKTEDYLKTLYETDRTGLGPLLIAWGQEKDEAHSELLDHLQKKSYHKFKQRFNRFLQSPGEGVAEVQTDPPEPNLVKDVAPVLIYTRLTSVRAYESILQSATLDQLHALRIEFKKLRYAVEFFREVLGDQVKDVISLLKDMQDHLGNLNDARVACQLIDDFLKGWELTQANLPLSERQSPEPIVAYLAAKHAERYALIVSFPETWAKFDSPKFRQDMAMAVSAL